MGGRKNFTLIELIVVIAIIAILSAIIAPNAFRAIDKSKVARMVTDMKTVKSACLGHYADTGQWPGLGMLRDTHALLHDTGVAGWDGPYLDKEARAPSWIGSVRPGCSPPGYYFLGSYDGWCCPEAYGYFDLDYDGVYEVTTGLSACIYGVPAPVRKGVNIALDGTYSDDEQTGVIKVWEGTVDPGGGCPGFIFYYVGSF